MAGKLGIPGLTMGMDAFSSMFDMDFVKKAWSLPSSFAPTIDVDELDKRIADLRAVEQWLNLNLGMLRGSIQALEIQRGTIAAVKAFGSVAAAAGQGAGDLAAALASVGPPGNPAPAPSASAFAPVRREEPEIEEEPEPEPEPEPTPRARPRQRTARAKGKSTPATGMAASATDAAMSPGAWWNLLQSQFNQVAQAAMSGVGLAAPDAADSKAASADKDTRDTKATAPTRARRPAKKKTTRARTSRRSPPAS